MAAKAANTNENDREDPEENALSLDEHFHGDHAQYLTFFMADEEYGVDILRVQEIRGWDSATPLPNAPSHIKGVINLRGTIIPIVDIRQCFNMQAVEYTPMTVVIVLKVYGDKGNSRVLGIVVDAVSDVYAINPEDMKAAPDLGNAMEIEFIEGLVDVDGKMVILLRLDELMSLDDLPDMSYLKLKDHSGTSV